MVVVPLIFQLLHDTIGCLILPVQRWDIQSTIGVVTT